MIIQNKIDHKWEPGGDRFVAKTKTTPLVFKGKRQKGNYMAKHKHESRYSAPREVYADERLMSALEAIVKADLQDEEMAQKTCAYIRETLITANVLKGETEVKNNDTKL